MKPLPSSASARRLWTRWFGPRVRREPCVVLTICVPDGVSAEAGFLVRDTLNAAKPDDWRFLNPGTFLAYFRTARSGVRRAHGCRADVEALRGADASLAGLTTALTAGVLVASFDRQGRLTSMPMGLATEDVPPLPEA